jgi:hypothetical protein
MGQGYDKEKETTQKMSECFSHGTCSVVLFSVIHRKSIWPIAQTPVIDDDWMSDTLKLRYNMGDSLTFALNDQNPVQVYTPSPRHDSQYHTYTLAKPNHIMWNES